MARDFTKNTSNFLTLGSGALGALLNGAGAISAHLHAQLDSKEAAGGGTQDDVLHIWIDNSWTGFTILLTSNAANAPVNVAARSRSGGTRTAVDSTTILSTVTPYRIGGVANYAANNIRVYINGTQEASSTGGWEDTSYVNGTPTTVLDSIGCNATLGTSPGSTTRQIDGLIGEVAVWNGDIGSAGFAQVGQGLSPLQVRPELLVCYWPLLGYASPEIDLLGNVAGTITGSVPKRDHPRTFTRTRRKLWAVPATAAVSTTHHIHLPLLGVG